MRAGSLARTLGLSPLLVGLTVLAFATSAPELAVSLPSAVSGNRGLAVGSFVGGNIANVLLILRMSAANAPLAVRSSPGATGLGCGSSLLQVRDGRPR